MSKVIHQTNTKQILKEARIFLPLLATTLLTVASASVLSSHTSTALDQNSVSASVKVSESCAMTISGADSHSVELVGGMVEQKIGESTISVACNDINGYSIYAVGYGNGTEGNTNLTGTTTGEIIPTGTDIPETSGNPVSQSQWAMRLSAVSSEFVPTIVSDSEGSFASNHKIPSTNTKVATFTNNISLTGFSKISTTYAVGVIPYQAADTYTGQVKYTLVHPNFADSNQKVYMQDLTPSMIADLLPNVGNTFVAYDKRDNQSYKIAKLADGKYWMVENLNLAGGTTITSADSDVTESFTLPESSSSPDFSSDTTATVYNSGSTNCSASKGCYSYYSYLAATAGTGSSVSTNGYNASGSICPKGWRLPTATTSNANAQSNSNWKTGDFYALATAYGANLESNYYQSSGTFYTNAGPGTTPSFLLSGNFDGTSFGNGGLRGYYWSSTANSSSNAYDLYFTSGYVYSANYLYRRYGFAVRCVFETRDITDISTMQEISPAIAANTAVGTSTTLTDSRGGVTKSYTVAKLADNKVWMTSNLDLPGGTTLTSSDTNLTTSFTLPASSTSGFSSSNTDYVYNSSSTYNDTSCGDNDPCYSYYSFYTATAHWGTNSVSSGSSSVDICPKGWRLPTNPEMSGITSSALSFSPVYSGRYIDSAFYVGGSYGYWWSSTVYSTNYAYNLRYYNGSLDINYNYNYFGCSIRCVAKS